MQESAGPSPASLVTATSKDTPVVGVTLSERASPVDTGVDTEQHVPAMWGDVALSCAKVEGIAPHTQHGNV